ncbi:NAD(P)/FAD-dependent oxidoreductase [Actinomadura rubrisoli]|uniref:FAD-dependent oxidoreductase n=1 Tax=Actinomadura rubrisoli TaxID=2530368 RepID=A0A4R5C8W5_9ACTN|nr:FAD-binding oxidoreductase [Actinomadura rubrisoli]TDD93442.1 FAD-dependent oxidoreductase [Actinomadura rubrisoli]
MKIRGDAGGAPGLWQSGLPPRPVRVGLGSDASADVVIVGAGFTGLWTAYYLRTVAPELSVIVLEAETAGFGASGRNGGWCSGELPGGPAPTVHRYGKDAGVAMQRAAFAAVEEVGRVVEREGIDCRMHRGGSRLLALSDPQAARLTAMVTGRHALGFGSGDYRLLGPKETSGRIAAAGVVASSFTPHCAALDPARLAHGLAEAAEARGAVIHERSAVREIRPGLVRTDHGSVRAEAIVRATEGYTPAPTGARRSLATVHSYMIATEPLPEDVWEAIGWDDHATLADLRLHFTYLQRTGDGRIALGGRGIGNPAGPPGPAHDRAPAIHRRLAASLDALFPQLGGAAAISHRWGGPMAIARDFHPRAGFDRARGLGWAGGYGGDGIALANLAGRTLAHLIVGVDSEETRLCWVGHRSPRWEPGPLPRWGIGAMSTLAHGVDRYEARTGRALPVLGPLITRLFG